MENKLTRNEVYKAIDSERDYQDKKGKDLGWGHGQGAQNHSVGDYITMLQAYTNKLHETYVSSVGDEQSLECIRKIAGIAVSCMEKHGVNPRK